MEPSACQKAGPSKAAASRRRWAHGKRWPSRMVAGGGRGPPRVPDGCPLPGAGWRCHVVAHGPAGGPSGEEGGAGTCRPRVARRPPRESWRRKISRGDAPALAMKCSARHTVSLTLAPVISWTPWSSANHVGGDYCRFPVTDFDAAGDFRATPMSQRLEWADALWRDCVVRGGGTVREAFFCDRGRYRAVVRTQWKPPRRRANRRRERRGKKEQGYDRSVSGTKGMVTTP